MAPVLGHSGSIAGSVLSQFHPSSSLLMHPGKQQEVAYMLAPLPSMWETQMGFLPAAFSPAQPLKLQPFGE